MTEEHADETMVASMRADAERQGTDDRKVTDAPHYLARVLMANGIRNMYGVVGIPVTDFARIAQGMGMRFVGMRHEEDAVNAAAADGFITGRPAVTLTVSAPGFLNGLPALLEATVNGYPVIMIGGSSTRHVVDLEEGEYEGLDQMNYAKQFCKASLRIDRIEDIPLAVARAMHIASSGRPGAVYIDFPDDTVAQTLSQSEADRLMWTATDPAPAMVPARESIDAALALLQQAERPLMVIGKGAAIARAEEEIREIRQENGYSIPANVHGQRRSARYRPTQHGKLPFHRATQRRRGIAGRRATQLDAVVRPGQNVERTCEIHPNRHQSGRNRKHAQYRRTNRGGIFVPP